MKKRYIIFVFLIIVLMIVFLKNIFCFDNASLDGEHVIDTHISIIGDYIFYESKSGWLGKANNLQTGEKKIVGIGMYNVNACGDELYYFAQRNVNPESLFRKRGVEKLIESNVTPCRVSAYDFYKDYLYFQKHSYSTDYDGKENGYIYRMNLDTNEIEKIVGIRSRNFYINDDIMYYTYFSQKGYDNYGEILSEGIISYNLLDGKESIVVEGWIDDFATHGENIVYSEYEENGKYHLSWLNTDLNIITEISKDIAMFRLYSENLCFIECESQEVINVFNLLNKNMVSVAAKDIDSSYGFVLYKNVIYYYDQEHNLRNVTI